MKPNSGWYDEDKNTQLNQINSEKMTLQISPSKVKYQSIQEIE